VLAGRLRQTKQNRREKAAGRIDVRRLQDRHHTHNRTQDKGQDCVYCVAKPVTEKTNVYRTVLMTCLGRMEVSGNESCMRA
jgi:hypothetical protein